MGKFQMLMHSDLVKEYFKGLFKEIYPEAPAPRSTAVAPAVVPPVPMGLPPALPPLPLLSPIEKIPVERDSTFKPVLATTDLLDDPQTDQDSDEQPCSVGAFHDWVLDMMVLLYIPVPEAPALQEGVLLGVFTLSPQEHTGLFLQKDILAEAHKVWEKPHTGLHIKRIDARYRLHTSEEIALASCPLPSSTVVAAATLQSKPASAAQILSKRKHF